MHQNRYRGSSETRFPEEPYMQREPERPRYPGSASGEFSQFGGPHPEGYREWGGGEAGYSRERGERGQFGGGYGEQSDYGQWGGYRSRALGSGESGRMAREDYPRTQPSGYPDYSTPEQSRYGAGAGGRGYRGQSQDYGYSTQERGSMGAATDRDWEQYERSGGGYESRQGARGFGGEEWGYRAPYTRGGAYGGSFAGSGAGARYGGGGGAETSERLRRRQGPKGYQRSDERVREQVVEHMMNDSDVDLQDVECDVKDGVVTLSGNVCSRRCRHELEDVADSVWGVKEVVNNLRVKSPEESGGSHQTETKPGGRETAHAGTGSGKQSGARQY